MEIKKIWKGLVALSPMVVFMIVYLVSSILAKDFYTIPIASAFLIASVYAIAICRGKSLEQRIKLFSKGAGDKNVLLMIWIFILAGAFASTAKDIGAIDATVTLALRILPGKVIFAGLFVASCFISMSIGTSIGTVVALVPVAAGIAEEAAVSTSFIAAIVVGGAFFGDNLSFISDTTIVATRTQGCSMSDKFKANLKIVLPAALISCGIYIFQGSDVNINTGKEAIEWIRVFPYLLIIILALKNVNVSAVLTVGIIANAIIGLWYGDFSWGGWLSSIGVGIAGMGDLIIVTMLAGGLLEIIRENGGIDFIVDSMTKRITSKRGAEFSIAGLVSLANLCTANNTIAIITTGSIAKDISTKFGVDPRKSASILDTFSCLVQGFIPYGAQILMASALSEVSPINIITYLYYPLTMGICAIFAILFRYPRKYS